MSGSSGMSPPWNCAAVSCDRAARAPPRCIAPRTPAGRECLVQQELVARGELDATCAPRFSRSRSRRVVPKIGTTSGPCPSSQASATWAGVALHPFGQAPAAGQPAPCCGRSSRPAAAAGCGGNRPRAGPRRGSASRSGNRGRAANTARGRSRARGRPAESPPPAPLPQRVLGLQDADRVHRVRPADGARRRPRTDPGSAPCRCRTSSAMAPTTSSIGTAGSTRCWYSTSMRSVFSRLSEASTTSRMCSGRLSTPRGRPSAPIRKPNFVARSTRSRRAPASSRPTSFSFSKGP